jgi:hypothetical protein
MNPMTHKSTDDHGKGQVLKDQQEEVNDQTELFVWIGKKIIS